MCPNWYKNNFLHKKNLKTNNAYALYHKNLFDSQTNYELVLICTDDTNMCINFGTHDSYHKLDRFLNTLDVS